MDEAHSKVRGEWVCLCCAVDKAGVTGDFYLNRQNPHAASHRAVANFRENGELPKQVVVRSSKYLSNWIEQPLRPLPGLKSVKTADTVISGIELAEKIRKGPFKLGKLGGRRATLPEIWLAALAATHNLHQSLL